MQLRWRLGWAMGSCGASTLLNGVSFLALYCLSRVLGYDLDRKPEGIRT
jgi:hypothetical protein